MLKKLSVIAALAFVSAHSYAEIVKLECDIEMKHSLNSSKDSYKSNALVVVYDRQPEKLGIEFQTKAFNISISSPNNESNTQNSSNENQWYLYSEKNSYNQKIQKTITIDRNTGIIDVSEIIIGQDTITWEAFGKCKKVNLNKKLF